MNEIFDLTVYRREGRLWVGAHVPSEAADRAVDDLYPADGGMEGLTRALVQADQRARQEMALPRSERFRDNKGFWLAAGCKTWRKFMRGLTSCVITREAEQTTVEYWVPDPKYPGGLTGTDFQEHYPPNISYEELAPIVLGIFATHPPDVQVPIAKAKPKSLP